MDSVLEVLRTNPILLRVPVSNQAVVLTDENTAAIYCLPHNNLQINDSIVQFLVHLLQDQTERA